MLGSLAEYGGSAAEPESRRYFDVPAGDAAESLQLFAEQSGRQIIYPSDRVAGIRTVGIKGRFTPAQT